MRIEVIQLVFVGEPTWTMLDAPKPGQRSWKNRTLAALHGATALHKHVLRSLALTCFTMMAGREISAKRPSKMV